MVKLHVILTYNQKLSCYTHIVFQTPGSSVTFGLRKTSCKHNIGEEAKVLGSLIVIMIEGKATGV